MKKLFIMILCLLTITAVDAQNRKTRTRSTSGLVKKSTTGKKAGTGKAQRSIAKSNPQVIFSLPDDKITEEDNLSSMNTQLFRMKKYVEIPSTFQFFNKSGNINYKLLYAIRKDDGIQVRILNQSKTDLISYISSMELIQGDKTITGERMNKAFLTEDYKITGVRYVDDFLFKTNKLIDKIDQLKINCIDVANNGNDICTNILTDVEVRESEGTDFLYQTNGKLDDLKTDNNSLLLSLGFNISVKETELDGLNVKVKKVSSFNGKIVVDLSITNNTDRKKRITFYDEKLPFIVTTTGRKLPGQPNGTRNGNNINIDIEGGSTQNERITFDDNGEDTRFIQLLHFFDTQSEGCVIFKNLPVDCQPKPHGELRFDMTWGEAKNLGYVTDGRGGDCTYSVYEGVDFNSCRLGFPDSNEGKLQNVHFESHDELARAKYNKISSILKKKYIQTEIDKSKDLYDYHDHPLIFITTNRDYWLKLNLNEPAFGATRVTLDIIKNK